MTAESFLTVGKLRAPHGISGVFNFSLDYLFKSNKNFPTHFFIPHKGSPLPYFIREVKMLEDLSGHIGFEEIKNREEAKQFSNCELLLPEKDFAKWFKKSAVGFEFLIGYKAIDQTKGDLGLITSLMDNPAQTLAVIDYNGNELIIPLVDELVLEINKRKKEILFAAPEGLIDLYS